MSEWQTTNKAVSVWGGVSAAISVPLPKCANTRNADSSATRLKQQIQKYRQSDAGPKKTRIGYLHTCLNPANWPVLPEFALMMKMAVEVGIKTQKDNFTFFCTNPETQRRWPKSFQRSGWRGLSKIFRSGRWYNYTITTHRICLSEDVLERVRTLLLLE